jgi:hypothetical protein
MASATTGSEAGSRCGLSAWLIRVEPDAERPVAVEDGCP